MRFITLDYETRAIQGRPNYPPEPAGVAVKWPARVGRYYAWGHPEENNCTYAQAMAALHEVAQSPLPIVMHNASFDLAVWYEKMGLPMPAACRIHDTMILAHLNDPYEPTFALKPLAEKHLNLPPTERDAVRDWLAENAICRTKDWGAFISYAPGKLVGTYAVGDVDRTAKLFTLLHAKIVEQGMSAAYDRERFLIPVLMENERRGVRVDLAALEADCVAYSAAIETTDQWLRKRTRTKALNVDSNEELADALASTGIVTEFDTTPTGKRSVAKNTLTRDKFNDERVFLALGYRNRLQTTLGTFMGPWTETARRSGGRIFTRWRQLGAVTGRMSSSPNFQNIPKSWTDKPDGYKHPAFLKVPELPLLRKYLLADEGSVLVAADYSSQEVRVAAHYEDGELQAAYIATPDMDPHAFVRDTIQKLTEKLFDRRTCKIALFSTLYGAGARKIGEQLGMSEDAAREVRDALRAALPGIFDLDMELKARARAGTPYRTLGGRVYHAEPSKMIDGQVRDFSYKSLNTIIQGSSADMTKAALLRYDSCKDAGRLLLCVHDEIVVSVPREKALDEARILIEAMVTALPLDVPVLAEAKLGDNYADMKELP